MANSSQKRRRQSNFLLPHGYILKLLPLKTNARYLLKMLKRSGLKKP